MDAVTTPKDFLAQPHGRCIFGRHWMYFSVREGLHGYTLWGRPTREEIEQLIVVLEAMLAPGIARHVTLVDTSRVEAMEEEAFDALAAYVARHRAVLERKIERVAIVRPSGLFGAAARGFFAIIEPPYEVGVFAHIHEALSWLGAPQALAAELEQLHERAADTTPLLRDLRTLIAAHPGRAELGAAARSLGVSPRALQRHLLECGTTFREEQLALQMRKAEALLLEGASSITQIAYAIGCSSPAHFSELFRKRKGESPTAWRLRRGAPAPPDERAAG